MKACVKATGKVVEVKCSRQIGPDAVYRDLVTGKHYMDFELSFLPEDGTPDYWTRLEHQAAISAMQGLLSNPSITERELTTREGIIEDAERLAYTLVEKYKKEEK